MSFSSNQFSYPIIVVLVLALQGYVADHSEGKSSQQDQMVSWFALLPLGSSLVFCFFFWWVSVGVTGTPRD